MSDFDQFLHGLMNRQARRRFPGIDLVKMEDVKNVNKVKARMIVTTVEDWDEEVNDMWDNEKLKSIARDLHCHNCKKQIVMSNALFAEYQKDPRPDDIFCFLCAQDEIKKETRPVVTEYKPTTCVCGNILSASQGAGHNEKPVEGDVSICAYCARMWIFNADLSQREPTKEEEKEIMSSEDWPQLQELRDFVLKRNI